MPLARQRQAVLSQSIAGANGYGLSSKFVAKERKRCLGYLDGVVSDGELQEYETLAAPWLVRMFAPERYSRERTSKLLRRRPQGCAMFAPGPSLSEAELNRLEDSTSESEDEDENDPTGAGILPPALMALHNPDAHVFVYLTHASQKYRGFLDTGNITTLLNCVQVLPTKLVG